MLKSNRSVFEKSPLSERNRSCLDIQWGFRNKGECHHLGEVVNTLKHACVGYMLNLCQHEYPACSAFKNKLIFFFYSCCFCCCLFSFFFLLFFGVFLLQRFGINHAQTKNHLLKGTNADKVFSSFLKSYESKYYYRSIKTLNFNVFRLYRKTCWVFFVFAMKILWIYFGGYTNWDNCGGHSFAFYDVF